MEIIKRNGEKQEYKSLKVIKAIENAMLETEKGVDEDLTSHIEKTIRVMIENGAINSVEEVQDMIEEMLMETRKDVAKKYILYRAKRTELREQGWEMTELEKGILENRYMQEGETFEKWLCRVSGGNERIKKRIRDKQFLFGGRILASRGVDAFKSTLSNCYVLNPPQDSIEGIFKTASEMARTYSYGGGVGISLRNLRPEGSKVNNSAKETSGAVSFMELYDLTTKIIAQRGRRGALMISMPVLHPDIEEFVDIKLDTNKITKANISIEITDDFMNAVKEERIYKTHFEFESNGRKQTIEKEINARKLLMRIAENNWRSAEPGMLFWDRISNYHLLAEDPEVEFAGTNPCGEQPLMAYGSCLLGAINLSEFVKNSFEDDASFDYCEFVKCVEDSVVAMNEVLDEGIELHPLQEQRDMARDYRQIGIGIMGWADTLVKLGITYGSPDSLRLADMIGDIFKNTAVKTSAKLAGESNPFPKYNYETISKSNFFKSLDFDTQQIVKEKGLRNSQLLTIAPTGSTSTMLGVSGGLEPIFALSFIRSTHNEEESDTFQFKVFAKVAQEYMKKYGIVSEEGLPEFFIVSREVPYKNRIDMQSVWQKHIDASISSTVNLPEETTIEEVADLYMYAWEKGLKGITIYRDNCERTAVLLTKPKAQVKEIVEEQPITTGLFATCPSCKQEKTMFQSNGCATCSNCGFSPCS